MGLRRIAKEGLILTNRGTQMFDTSKQPPTMNASKRTEPNHNNKIKPFTAARDASIKNGGTTSDKPSISITGDGSKPSIFRPTGDVVLNGTIDEKNILSSNGGIDDSRLFPGSSGDVAMPATLLKGSPFLEAALGVISSSVDPKSSFIGNERTRSPDYHRSMPPDLVDSLPSSLDSIAWNQDGTQTIIENGSRTSTKSSTPINEEYKNESATLEEIRKLREENKQLKKSVEEAAAVNCAWRKFHEDRQGYVQRLLTTIHELQHANNKKHSEQQEGAVGTSSNGSINSDEAETRKLKEDLARLQAEHHDHVTLLEMQVRAHRDDWEAERSDKKAAQKALEETEARAAQLLEEIQQLQTKISESGDRNDLCRRCSASRSDEGTTLDSHPTTNSIGTNNLNSSSRFSPVTTESGCSHTASSSDSNSTSSVASSLSPPAAVPQTAVTDLPTTPLKGWIPVSMLHHIAFSGQTPEHQSSPMMGRQQQQQRFQQQQHQMDPSLQRNKQTQQRSQQKPRQPQSKHQHTHPTQQTLQKSAFPINSINKTKSLNDSENNFRNIFSQDKSIIKKKNDPNDKMMDKKSYELMGARPKVMGESKGSPLISTDNSTISGGTDVILENEFQAKHRARSILASAIPISPSSPTSSFAPMRSPSVPNMLKGYMPITSTILTPINFRPCSSQRRQSVQTTTASLISDSLNQLSNQDRSDSSPALLETPSETIHSFSENIPQNLKDNNNAVDMNINSSSKSTTDQPGCSTEESCIAQGSTVTNTLTCSKDSTHNEICTSIPSAYRSVKVECESEGPTSSSSNSNECISSPVSATNSTSITVTTTAEGVCNSSTTSTYSSATSSRSSSPGFSLTTFALNSEGRGIPGTIFFAMGNEQKGCLSPPPRSPQPSVSPGRTSAASLKSPTPEIVTAGLSISPPSIKSPPIGPNTRIKSPSIQINSTKSPPNSTNNAQSSLINPNNSHKNHSKSKTQEHWWSVEGPNAKSIKQKGGDNSKLVNSTWVRLMGGEAHSKTGASLPWRTARAVPGHQLDQVRRSSQEEKEELSSNFNYSPAMTSPSNSVFSSSCPSAATSPPPGFEVKPKSPEKDLKEIASKNIASAIISYELGAKTEANTTPNTTTYTITNPPPLPTTHIHDNSGKENRSGECSRGSSITSNSAYMSDGVETLTRVDLVCPTCQMLFSHDRHLLFLDHFETCRGPTYVDM